MKTFVVPTVISRYASLKKGTMKQWIMLSLKDYHICPKQVYRGIRPTCYIDLRETELIGNKITPMPLSTMSVIFPQMRENQVQTMKKSLINSVFRTSFLVIPKRQKFC